MRKKDFFDREGKKGFYSKHARAEAVETAEELFKTLEFISEVVGYENKGPSA